MMMKGLSITFWMGVLEREAVWTLLSWHFGYITWLRSPVVLRSFFGGFFIYLSLLVIEISSCLAALLVKKKTSRVVHYHYHY